MGRELAPYMAAGYREDLSGHRRTEQGYPEKDGRTGGKAVPEKSRKQKERVRGT